MEDYGDSQTELIGILSDAHGNGPAFQRGVEILRDRGASRFVFLGDAIGYIPSDSVLIALSDLGKSVICIKGNHEEMLMNLNENNDLYQLDRTKEKLSKFYLDYIKSWPESHVEQLRNREILYVHGSPEKPTHGYIYPDSDLTKVKTRANLVIMGNTHRPFIRNHNSKMFVNVGSCGLPRDDGRYASIATLNAKTLEVKILRYDILTITKRFLSLHEVHPDVINLTLRRQSNLIGELID